MIIDVNDASKYSLDHFSEAEIAAGKEEHDTRRSEIIASVKAGKVSLSMSGFEYYHQPWDSSSLYDRWMRLSANRRRAA